MRPRRTTEVGQGRDIWSSHDRPYGKLELKTGLTIQNGIHPSEEVSRWSGGAQMKRVGANGRKGHASER